MRFEMLRLRRGRGMRGSSSAAGTWVTPSSLPLAPDPLPPELPTNTPQKSYLTLARHHLPTHPLCLINISTPYARTLLGTPGLSFSLNYLVLASPLGALFIYSARSTRAPVYAWTVNARPWMKWAVWAGLDGVVTDEVEIFREVVGAAEGEEGARKGGSPVGVWRSVWLSGAHLLAAVAVAAYSVLGGGRLRRRPKRREKS